MSRSGDWVVLHGTPLISSSARRVAVIVEPAHPARIAPLLMAAYGLTGREQEVTRLVLQGNSTTEIAQGLRMSTGTVQQHLKSVFDKTGVVADETLSEGSSLLTTSPASETTNVAPAKASLCRAGRSRAHVLGVWRREFRGRARLTVSALVIEKDPDCSQK